MLDALLGFVLALALLSMVVTLLAQGTQSLLRIRGRNLHRGLESVFGFVVRELRREQAWTKDRVALLVVHGIGQQKVGRTLDGFVHGLTLAYPHARVDRRDETSCVLRHQDSQVFVYEVHWADVLDEESVRYSFGLERLHQTVWFPSLNLERRERIEGGYRYEKQLVSSWTWILRGLAWVVTAGYCGVAILGTPIGAHQELSRSQKRREDDTIWRRAWRSRRWLDNWLAVSVGDVFNYVDACVGRRSTRVENAPERIYRRLEEAIETARKDGCTEVQVVSHSLGSLITYHALTRFRERTVSALGEGARLTRWYTLGSPLEKILFFWPKAIPLHELDEEDKIDLCSFRIQFDPVSGDTRHFDGIARAENRLLRGGGGVVRAHRAYKSHPDLLSVLGRHLTGAHSSHGWTPIGRKTRQLWALVENLGVALLGMLAVGAGIASFFLIGAFLGCGPTSLAAGGAAFIDCMCSSASGAGWAVISGGVLVILTIVRSLWQAKAKAAKIHEAFWLGTATRETPDRHR